MKGTKEAKKEWIAELKKMQKSYQGGISPDDPPFDLTAEPGEVVTVELKGPGVYYIVTRKAGDTPECPEVYAVTADAPAISEKVWTYGQEFPGHPDLRAYDILQPKSGRYIIDSEMRRYQIKCHLSEIEDEDSLYTVALYGAEEYPDYFDAFPVSSFTLRGFTVRHKTIPSGMYWLETDRCEEMLAVRYPIWKSDISIPEQNQGEQLEYGHVYGIDNTPGYLFFSKQNSVIPLHELSLFYPGIKGSSVVDMDALPNAICGFYPEYVTIHNEEEAKFEHGRFMKETPGVGAEFIKF